MSDECKTIDPTAFGLFFVALVSLPLALSGILGYLDIENDIGDYTQPLLILGGIFILIASIKAYSAGSNFGFIVFGLVSFGVLFVGLVGGDMYINIVLGIIYLICLVWSVRAGTLKTITLILLTTALVFFANGCGAEYSDATWPVLFLGIAALLNFILTIYLAFALADEKLPCY